MKWFLGAYTARFNRKHKLFGHLFSGRYKSLIVDGSGRGYLRTVCDYVHLNPARARLLRKEEKLSDYRWRTEIWRWGRFYLFFNLAEARSSSRESVRSFSNRLEKRLKAVAVLIYSIPARTLNSPMPSPQSFLPKYNTRSLPASPYQSRKPFHSRRKRNVEATPL